MNPQRLGLVLLLLALAGVPPLTAFQEPGHEEMIRQLEDRLERLHVRGGEELSPEERAGLEAEIEEVTALLDAARRGGEPRGPRPRPPFPPDWLTQPVVIAAIIGFFGAVITALIRRGRG